MQTKQTFLHRTSIPARTTTPRITLVLGAIVWAAVAVLLQPGWAETLLLLAVLVLAPLGITIVEEQETWFGHGRRAPRVGLVSLTAGLALVAAFALPAGPAAGFLATPWFVFTAWTALDAVRRAARRRELSAETFCLTGGALYLAVGGGWAVISRFGQRPMELSEVIVLLTAVHFHYAGFVLPVIAACTARAAPGRMTRAAAVGVVVAMPMVAIGMLMSPPLEFFGVVVITAACATIAAGQLGLAARSKRPTVMTLWTISSLSLLAGMTLAVLYGWCEFTGLRLEVVTIKRMIPLHGTLNGLGFSLAGLLAWRW